MSKYAVSTLSHGHRLTAASRRRYVGPVGPAEHLSKARSEAAAANPTTGLTYTKSSCYGRMHNVVRAGISDEQRQITTCSDDGRKVGG